jgi:4-aminobutyrate aminotransferase-like enzyme
MPGGSVGPQKISEASSEPEEAPPKIGPALLHRTPWTPPTAVRASGINIELEDGSQVVDAVGGAAVACLGMGNQKVMDAIITQLGNLTCKLILHMLSLSRSDKKQPKCLADIYATQGEMSHDEHNDIRA